MEQKKTPKRKNLVKTPKKITESYLYNSGLYYLNRYAASIEHFRFVMTRKIKLSITHHKAPTIEEALSMLQAVIDGFVADGLLNDEAYARGYINSLRRRGLSRGAILRKAQQKKLGTALTTEILKKLDDDTMDIPSEQQDLINQYGLNDNIELRSALIHAKKKRLGPYSKTDIGDDEKAYKRQLSSFARAGYGFEMARSILSMELISH